MTFSRRFRSVSFAVAILGMLCLGFAEFNPLYLGLIVVVTVVAWFRERFGARRAVPRAFLNVVILAAVVFAALDYSFISQGWIVSLAHFLLIVQMANLLLPRTERNYAQMYLISLMNVSVAAIVTVNLLFALAYVAYSILGIYGLVLFHFHREASRAGSIYLPDEGDTVRPTATPDLGRVISPRFTWTLMTVVAFTWFFNVTFFVFSPRVHGGFLRLNPMGILNRLTGFADRVRLGQIGRIIQSEEPVMHVRLRDSRGNAVTGENDFYWRGITYQHYDGREWHRLSPAFRPTDVIFREPPPHTYLGNGRLPHSGWIEQRITLDPVNSRTFFAMPGLLLLDCPGFPAISHNRQDESIQSMTVMHQVTKYRAVSVWPQRDTLLPKSLRPSYVIGGKQRFLQERFHRGYLQLPPEVTQRVRDFAKEIAPPADFPTPQARARRIEGYLKDNFGYTLDLRADPNVEPVEDFLFNRREGHCEYFAAAMVLLLRSSDIPSRLVSGFHGAEWSDVGEWYIVKQSDAHAWVEAWFDRDGWVRFDPTPAAQRNLAARAARFGWIGRWMDYVRTQWINHVVDYDHEQQTALLGRTRSMAASIRRTVNGFVAAVGGFFKEIFAVLTDFRKLTTPEGGMMVLGVLLASTALVLTMRWLLIRLARRLREHFALRRATRAGKVHVVFYSEFERVLKRRGLVRPPSATPQEFARAVAEHFDALHDGLRRLADAFYHVRFGAARLRPDEERELLTLVDLVRRAPATKPV